MGYPPAEGARCPAASQFAPGARAGVNEDTERRSAPSQGHAPAAPPCRGATDSARVHWHCSYGGADDPADDTDRTFVARNTQFELWIAAWLTAGQKQVRMCEPDVQVAQWFQWRGIAVKRIRSQAQILKRVKKRPWRLGWRVAEEARTRGFAAPALAGGALGWLKDTTKLPICSRRCQARARAGSQPSPTLRSTSVLPWPARAGAGRRPRSPEAPPKSAMPMMRAPLGSSVRSPGRERPPSYRTGQSASRALAHSTAAGSGGARYWPRPTAVASGTSTRRPLATS
jgi:hypothetical protein